jgi:hypothetical protein
MNILDTILAAQNGGAVRQVGQQLGLGEDQAKTALAALVPMLAGGFTRNMQSSSGLDGLAAALAGGQHARYLENPSTLHGATADGNGILGHVLGSKEVSRQVADRASQQSGLGASVL